MQEHKAVPYCAGRSLALVATLFMTMGFLGEETAAAANVQVLETPRLTMRLKGETGRRMDAIIRNWLLTAPGVNPGIMEMMRLRDRNPPYEGPTHWAGEFVGKYLAAAIQARRMTDDPALDKVVRRVVAEVISSQAEDGYLGPFPKHVRLLGFWDLWGHYHVMYALYMWYRETGDRTALDAAIRAADLVCKTYLDGGRRVYDAGDGVYNVTETNTAIIHILGILYRETGNEKYLQQMREIEEDWTKIQAADYYRDALRGIEFYQVRKPRWEGLHPMLGLGEFYRITGDESYRDALLHWWHSIRKTDIHNSGSFSSVEQAVGNPFHDHIIETCCTVAWVVYSVEALRLSGESKIADALELATWNAVLGHQHPSGRWCTYDTRMDGKRSASAHSIVFQARPGTPEFNCCAAHGPRGLTELSKWALLGDDKAIYLNYYGPGTIEADLGEENKWLFEQETDYPVGGNIKIRVKPPRRTRIPIHFRIPEWSANSEVSVNGKPVSGVTAGTYLTIDRKWKRKDLVKINLDMSVRGLRGDKYARFLTSLYKGPLLLAYDQKHNTLERHELPDLDYNNIELRPAKTDAWHQPIVLFETTGMDGRTFYLTDFATAGAHGTAYRSWLPIPNAPPAPFQLLVPAEGEHIPINSPVLAWTRAGDGVKYDLTISPNSDFTNPVVQRDLAEATEVTVTNALTAGQPYYWRITARQGKEKWTAKNGPRTFIPDSALTMAILRVPMDGSAEPAAGKLVEATDIEPTVDRHGKEGAAMLFNGKTSKLTYHTPHFPFYNYTFSAWFISREMKADDWRIYNIVSGWCRGADDPMRIGISHKKLVSYIEHWWGSSAVHGPLVPDDVWTHVAFVKDTNELRLYINGKRIGQSNVQDLAYTGAHLIGIGCNPLLGHTESFNGSIDDVLLTRRAMSDDEILKLFQGQ